MIHFVGFFSLQVILFTFTSAQPGPIQISPECFSYSWGYSSPFGPSTWGEHCPTCIGNNQSPININTNSTVPGIESRRMQLNDFNSQPYQWTIENVGVTVKLQGNWSTNSSTPSITNGPDPSATYTFEEMHFHFGANDSVGSEHSINGVRFPMAMHFVTYKTLYGSYRNAMTYPDGIMALAVFSQISDSSSGLFGQLASWLSQIGSKGQTILDSSTSGPMTMFSPDVFFPAVTSSYYNYFGSYGFPPCVEVVSWNIMSNLHPITQGELDLFRQLTVTDGHLMENNFRPQQPLNNRTIYYFASP